MHLVPVMAVGKIYSNSFLYLLNSRGTYRKVSSLRTAEFARSLDRSNGGDGSNGAGGVRVHRNGGATGTGPRGLGALKFAPNEDITTRGSAPVRRLDSLSQLFFIFGPTMTYTFGVT